MAETLSLRFERAVDRLVDLPSPALPEVALLGRSNVGKSSLLNRVGGSRKLARTSRAPGRTQTINFYHGGSFRLVDLPGYGYAKAPDAVRLRWGKLVEAYLQKRECLRAGLLVLDIRRRPNEMDGVMRRWLVDRAVPFLAVLTKSDKLKRGAAARAAERITALLGLGPEDAFLFSAKTGDGAARLAGWIRSMGKR